MTDFARKVEEEKIKGGYYDTLHQHRPDPYKMAAKWKAEGIQRLTSYSRWVQATGLHPDMDAKDWYKIWDSVPGEDK